MSDRATPRLVVESFQWPVDVIKGYAIWDTERKMPIARLLIADGEYTVHDDVRGIAQQMADKLNAHDRLTRENDKMRRALQAIVDTEERLIESAGPLDESLRRENRIPMPTENDWERLCELAEAALRVWQEREGDINAEAE